MYNSNNIFAKMIRNEMPCAKVYEDESTLIFTDCEPIAPIHLLAIPKSNFKSFDDFTLKASKYQLSSFFKSIQKVTHEYKINESGYRLITNHGTNSIQTVEHFHVHIIGGKKLGPLISSEKDHINK